MEVNFNYDKKKVIQGLRFHFLTRFEVRILIILVNVFAIFSAALFYFNKVSPLAFLISSVLWILLMAAFWFFLPKTVYKKASTFKNNFKMSFEDRWVRLRSDQGYTEWPWEKFSTYFESPHFIHLYFDSRSFFLVPKTALEDQGILSGVRKLLSIKIPKKK